MANTTTTDRVIDRGGIYPVKVEKELVKGLIQKSSTLFFLPFWGNVVTLRLVWLTPK